MIQIGQKIDDFIDDLEFEAYQNNEIKEVKFSDYEGKWLVLLFYLTDFTFICPTELQEADEGAEILNVSTDAVFVHKAWHDNSPSVVKIGHPMVADPATEDLRLPVRGTFIIDPNGVLKAGAFTTRTSARSIAGIGFGRQVLGRIRDCLT